LRFLLKKRLLVDPQLPEPLIPEDDPLELNALERYGLARELVENMLTGEFQPEEFLTAARAGGMFPAETPGILAESAFRFGVEQLYGRMVFLSPGEPLPAVNVDLELSGIIIRGRLEHIHGKGLFFCDFANADAKRQLETWIHLLLLEQCTPAEIPRTALLLGRDTTWRWESPENSGMILQQLLELTRRGLCEPLVFSPAVGLKLLEKPEAARKIRESLARDWEERSRNPGEKQLFQGPEKKFLADPYLEQAWRGRTRNPFGTEFAELALAVLGPMYEHREELL
jgi:exonuclease V gamma subunit